MPVYVIRGDTVAAHAKAPTDAGPDDVIVGAQADLEKSPLGNGSLAAIWDGLPGARPITKFKDRATAARRLWAAFEAMPLAARGHAPVRAADARRKSVRLRPAAPSRRR